MSKCTGCGVVLQNINKDKLGYTTSLNNKLCECRKMKISEGFNMITIKVKEII